MDTDWVNDELVAKGFDSYDDLPERTIGYPTVFSQIGLERSDVRMVLDYGCGPGKVAVRMANAYGVDVIGVDVSDRMLELAQHRRSHTRVRYELLRDARVEVLSNNSVDAAMSCYVFINIGDRSRLQEIAAEVYRVLRPGGRYAVLDTNPRTTGIRFSTFLNGEPGRSYRVGERRRVVLYLPDETELELIDYHWPVSVYREVLTGAGFRDVVVSEPLLADAVKPDIITPELLKDSPEATRAPFLVVAGEK